MCRHKLNGFTNADKTDIAPQPLLNFFAVGPVVLEILTENSRITSFVLVQFTNISLELTLTLISQVYKYIPHVCSMCVSKILLLEKVSVYLILVKR